MSINQLSLWLRGVSKDELSPEGEGINCKNNLINALEKDIEGAVLRKLLVLKKVVMRMQNDNTSYILRSDKLFHFFNQGINKTGIK